MTVFPTAAHLVSWARWSPQVKQSAGKRKGNNATGRGNPYLGAALGEAAIGAGRTQTFLGARYRRLARRMPKKKALVAAGNSMLTIVHACSSDPDPDYHDLGPATTNSACTPAARPATTSAASNASATKSPSRPSTPAPANSSPRPADRGQTKPGGARAAGRCRAPSRGLIFGPAQIQPLVQTLPPAKLPRGLWPPT